MICHEITKARTRDAVAAFIVALMLGNAASCRATRTPERDQRYVQQLEPLIERFVHWQEIPGLALGVVQNGQLVYARAFGVKHLGRPTDALTTRSLFHMASITKPFVATAIMQLMERGDLDLDAPVAKYLPYFRLADDRYNQITVRQMVTHTSGMPAVEDYERDRPQYDDGALERYVRSRESALERLGTWRVGPSRASTAVSSMGADSFSGRRTTRCGRHSANSGGRPTLRSVRSVSAGGSVSTEAPE